MSIIVIMSLGCILEAIASPIEAAIKRPRVRVYRKPDRPTYMIHGGISR